MSNDLPPFLRPIINGLGRIGYKAISAAVNSALKSAGEITEEIDRRVKKGAKAAERMANGDEYNPDTEDPNEEPKGHDYRRR